MKRPCLSVQKFVDDAKEYEKDIEKSNTILASFSNEDRTIFFKILDAVPANFCWDTFRNKWHEKDMESRKKIEARVINWSEDRKNNIPCCA